MYNRSGNDRYKVLISSELLHILYCVSYKFMLPFMNLNNPILLSRICNETIYTYICI